LRHRFCFSKNERKNLNESGKRIRGDRELEKVKDVLKRKSKGQNVTDDLAKTILFVIFVIIVVYYICEQIRSLMPPNTPFTTAMNYTSLLLGVAIAAPFVPPIIFLLLQLLLRRL